MPNIIYTVAVGESTCFKHCVESQRKYANRIGADFFCRKEWVNWNDDLKTDSEKRYIIDLLKEYDNVLYLDGDVFINKDALNIFEYYSDDRSSLIIYNEVMYNNVNMNNHIEKCIMDNNIEKWTKYDNRYNWLNAGVMLCRKGCEMAFKYDPKEFFKFADMPLIYDMPYMNYNIFKYKVEYTCMQECFNTMVYFHDNGHFLHFANVLDRDKRILDYV